MLARKHDRSERSGLKATTHTRNINLLTAYKLNLCPIRGKRLATWGSRMLGLACTNACLIRFGEQHGFQKANKYFSTQIRKFSQTDRAGLCWGGTNRQKPRHLLGIPLSENIESFKTQ